MTGAELRAAFEVAQRWLALNRDALNAINVYPVPDGDTGTNMLLTWRAAQEAAERPADVTVSVSGYLRAFAHGALLGARGNSGVILSQMLRGIAESASAADGLDGTGLAAAIAAGARAAYDAVPEPVEGTMLTVMREAADAAVAAARAGDAIDAVAAALAAEAHRSVERTPDLLPRLREAGVVDAGGLGVAVIFEGTQHGLAGTPLPRPRAASAVAVELGAVAHAGYGYCTEFVILGAGIDRHALERELAALGAESVLVVGDPDAAHVHAHVADPGPALSAGARLGALTAVKVEDMQAQHDAWSVQVARREPAAEVPPAEGEPPAIGLLVVVRGAGLTAAFRELGATAVITGGESGKPSPGELLGAARRAGRERVFLLPTDKDVLMAAEQAAREANGMLTIIPARTVAAGLAAAVAFMPDAPPDETAERMREALAQTRGVEVTRAVRDAVVEGIAVRAGDGIALLDGVLVARGDTLEDALLAGLARAVDADTSLVTVYLGADAPAGAGPHVRTLIAAAHPALEVEVVDGGQPHYPYLLSVE